MICLESWFWASFKNLFYSTVCLSFSPLHTHSHTHSCTNTHTREREKELWFFFFFFFMDDNFVVLVVDHLSLFPSTLSLSHSHTHIHTHTHTHTHTHVRENSGFLFHLLLPLSSFYFWMRLNSIHFILWEKNVLEMVGIEPGSFESPTGCLNHLTIQPLRSIYQNYTYLNDKQFLLQ